VSADDHLIQIDTAADGRATLVVAIPVKIMRSRRQILQGIRSDPLAKNVSDLNRNIRRYEHLETDSSPNVKGIGVVLH